MEKEKLKKLKKQMVEWVYLHKQELIEAGVITTGALAIGAIVVLILSRPNVNALTCMWEQMKSAVAKVCPSISKDSGHVAKVAEKTSTEVINNVKRSYTPSPLPFEVKSFVRKLPEGMQHSTAKEIEAAAKGIHLMKNETLVKSYTKGA